MARAYTLREFKQDTDKGSIYAYEAELYLRDHLLSSNSSIAAVPNYINPLNQLRRRLPVKRNNPSKLQLKVEFINEKKQSI